MDVDSSNQTHEIEAMKLKKKSMDKEFANRRIFFEEKFEKNNQNTQG